MPDVAAALKSASGLVASLKEFEAGGWDTAKHLTLLREVDQLRAELEEPFDTLYHWYAITTVFFAAYTLFKIGAFEALPATGTKTAKELAAECNVDESVITRSMRCVINERVVAEPEPDTYAHAPVSFALAPQALGCFLATVADHGKGEIAMPAYLKSHQPNDLYDVEKTPYAYSRGKEGMTYYQVIDSDPEERVLWNLCLQAIDKNMPILGMFPFHSLKDQVEKEPDRPFIVDIGGGRGQALLAIRGELGGSFGARCILQDLPAVIDPLKDEELPGIDKMVHDIFTPQPVKSEYMWFSTGSSCWLNIY